MTEKDGSRYVLISTDTHAGADIRDYKPYLDRQFHEEFDAWARDFSDGWSGLVAGDDPNRRFGVSSFLSSVNWDSKARNKHLEEEGIVGEVIFPNTVPPFYPSGVISAPGPRNKEEYARRWAGVQAHNRWVADFCSEVPTRRAGLAQIFLENLDDALAEVRQAKENGLKGILLPADHHQVLCNLFYPHLDELWMLCAELEMPVHRHSLVVSEGGTPGVDDAARALGFYEINIFAHRAMSHLILAGVFERFPDLKLVLTEQMCSWVPAEIAMLDLFCDGARNPQSAMYDFAYGAVSKLKRKPSEYFATNCYLATFFDRLDMEVAHDIGIERLMWGADYPHYEGTWPYTREALRANFAGWPEKEVRSMTSETAAEVYGFDLDELQKVADRIGPTPEEIAKPLQDDERPRDSRCPSLTEGQFVHNQ